MSHSRIRLLPLACTLAVSAATFAPLAQAAE